MKKKLLGIITLVTISICLLLAILVRLEGEFFKASNVQLLLVFFTASIVMAGLYSIKNRTKNSLALIGIPVLGLVLIGFSIAVSFNLIPFTTSYNWLIGLGLLYLMFIELQLLNWSNKPGIIPQICSFILILTHGFLIIFFVAKWSFSGLSLAIDIAVLISIIAVIVGVLTVRKENVELPIEHLD